MAKEDEIGALWESETKDGSIFLKGKIDGRPVLIFRNKFKQPGEKTPDWRVFPQRPMPDHVQQATQPKANPEPSPVADDDIPF